MRRVTELERYEEGFRKAGLPMLIEDYSPAADIFNRAVPLLGLVFLGEMLVVLNRQWSTIANIAAVLGGLAILLLAIALSNRARGDSFRAVPRSVGWVELAGFVIIPALLPGVISDHWGIATLTALANIAILALILGVVGFGVLSIISWAMSRFLGQLASSFALLVKAVPLLMIFALILFLTTEMWQVFASLNDLSLGLLIALFLALGVTFLVARLPVEVARIEEDAGEGPPLKKRQRFNVGLVLFVSQSLQVLVVSLAVGLFFIVFGVLTVDAKILDSWIHTSGHVLVSFNLGGREAILTRELIRVAGALAAFTGLYFTISMLTDATYRHEFLDQLTGEMRQTFHRHTEYLKLRARSEGPSRD